MTLQLDDGTVLPEPRRTLHRHAWNWPHGGYSSGLVAEDEYQTLLRLVAQVNDGCKHPAEAAFRMSELLGAIIQHRMSEGWLLVSADASSATLVRDPRLTSNG